MGLVQFLPQILVYFGVVAVLYYSTKTDSKFPLRTRSKFRRSGPRGVPLAGGFAIGAGVVASALLIGESLSALHVLSCVVLFLGMLDDRFEFKAKIKLPVEILMASIWIAMIPHDRLVFNSFGLPPLVTQALSIFWIVGMTNAMNLSDGIDGLTASIAIGTLALISLFGVSGHGEFIAALLPGLIAFLPFNFSRRKKVYLGDGGSLFLGFSIAGLLSVTSWGQQPSWNPWVSLLLVSYPQVDTVYAIFRRWRAGRKIMDGDKEHIHHRLVGFGMSHKEATFIITSLVSLVSLSLIFSAQQITGIAPFVILCAAVLLSLFTVIRLAHFWKLEKADWQWNLLKQRIIHSEVGSDLRSLQPESQIWVLDPIKLLDNLGLNDPHQVDLLCTLVLGAGRGILSMPIMSDDTRKMIWIGTQTGMDELTSHLKAGLAEFGLSSENLQIECKDPSQLDEIFPALSAKNLQKAS